MIAAMVFIAYEACLFIRSDLTPILLAWPRCRDARHRPSWLVRRTAVHHHGDRVIVLDLPTDCLTRLRREASARQTTVDRLIREVVVHVVEDDLYDAVIDDDEALRRVETPTMVEMARMRMSLAERRQAVLRAIDASPSGEITISALAGAGRNGQVWYSAIVSLERDGTIRRELRHTPGKVGGSKNYFSRTKENAS